MGHFSTRTLGQLSARRNILQDYEPGGLDLSPVVAFAVQVSVKDGAVQSNIAQSHVYGTTLLADPEPGFTSASPPTPVTPTNRSSEFVYDRAGRLVYTVDAERYVTETSYDGAGRAIKQTGYSKALAVGVAVSETAIRNALALAGAKDPARDRVSRSFYSSDGLLHGMLDAEGYLTELKYDAGGRQTETIRYAAPTNTSLRASGTLADLKNPPAGSPLASADDLKSYCLYDGKGQKVGYIDEMGFLTEHVYDRAGNKLEDIRYSGTVAYGASKPMGQYRSEAVASAPAGQPDSRKHVWQYDGLNRVTQETDAEGTVTTYKYHAVTGLLYETTRADNQVDWQGSSEERTTTIQHDALGRGTNTIDGEGSAALAAAGNQAAVDAVWRDFGVKHVYDLAGRRVKSIDQRTGQSPKNTLYYYDRDSRLRYTINAIGEVSETSYNSFGEVAATVQYAQRISAAFLSARSGGLIDLDPDLKNQLATLAGNLENRTTTTTYTLRGDLDSSVDALGYTTDFSYNAFKQAIGKVFDVGASPGASLRTDTYEHDRRGALTKTVEDSTGVARTTQIIKTDGASGYDAFGRMVSVKDPNDVYRTSLYDQLGRITRSTDPAGYVTTTYDAFSRIVTQTDRTTNSTTTYKYEDVDSVHSGAQAIRVWHKDGTNSSLSRALGTFAAGDTVTATVWYKANSDTQAHVFLGDTEGLPLDNWVEVKEYGNGEWRQLTVTRTMSHDDAMRIFIYGDRDGAYTNNTHSVLYDDIVVSSTLRGVVLSDGFENGLKLIDETPGWSSSGQTNDVVRPGMTVTTPEGVQTRRSFNRHGQDIAVSLSNNGVLETTTYSYDKDGRLTRVTDPTGFYSESEYDNASRLEASIEKNGGRTDYTYDAADRILARTDPVGHSTAYEYNAFGEAIRFTDPAGVVTETIYEQNGRIVHVISDAADRTGKPPALRLATSYIYDAQRGRTRVEEGRQATLTNGIWTFGSALRVTTHEYDGLGRRTKDIVDPGTGTNPTTGQPYLNITTTYQYDQNGNLTKKTDANDQVWRFAYDDNNRQIIAIDPLGGVTETAFDPEGRVTKVTRFANGLPNYTAATIPDNAKAASIARPATSSLDRITRTAYDKDGRAVYEVDALNYVTARTFDSRGNVVRTVRFSTALSSSIAITRAAIDAQIGNLGEQAITRHVYDHSDRLRYVIDALGFVTETRYDIAGGITETIRYSQSIAGNLVNNPSAQGGDASGWTAPGGTVPSAAPVEQAGFKGDGHALALTSRDTYSSGRFAVSAGETFSVSLEAIRAAVGDGRSPYDIRIGIKFYSTVPGQTSPVWVEGVRSAANAEGALFLTGTVTAPAAMSEGEAWISISGPQGSTGKWYFRNASVKRSQLADATWLDQIGDREAAVERRVLTDVRRDRRTTVLRDAAGREQFTVDALRYVIAKSYDSAGRVAQETTYSRALPIGSALTIAGVQLAIDDESLTAPDKDQTTSYEYDGAGRLRTLTDALGNSESYGYDRAGNRTALTNKEGRVWTYKYDAANRLIEERTPEAEFFSTAGLADGAMARKVTRYEYDALGNIQHRREGYGTGATTPTTFTQLRATQFLYDARGQQVSVVLASGAGVNVFNRPAENGGHIPFQDVASPQSWTYYDHWGQAVVNRDANESFTYKLYDLVGRLEYEIDAERYVTQRIYDSRGNVTTLRRYANPLPENDALGSPAMSLLAREDAVSGTSDRADAVAAHDWVRQKVALLSSIGSRTITTEYDKTDRKIVVRQSAVDYFVAGTTDRRGNDVQPTSTFSYDAFGGLVAQRDLRSLDPDGAGSLTDEFAVSYFGYDLLGRQLHQLDALGYYTLSTFDGLGRATSRTEYAQPITGVVPTPDFSNVTATPTAPSQLGAQNNLASGYDRTTEFSYDRANRVTTETASQIQYSSHNATSGTASAQVGDVAVRTFEYDKVGNVIAVSDASGATKRTYYDALGRVRATAEPARIAGSGSADSTDPVVRALTIEYDQTFRVIYVQAPFDFNVEHTSTVRWSSLAHLGEGPIRVTVRHAATQQYDGATNTWSTKSSASTIVSGNATSANVTYLVQGPGSAPGTSVLLEKQEIVGGVQQWVTIFDETGMTGKATKVEITNVPLSGSASLMYKRTETNFTSLPLQQIGNAYVASITQNNQQAGLYTYFVDYSQGPDTPPDLQFSLTWPGGQDPLIVQTGRGQEAHPLATSGYNALGELVVERRHALGTTSAGLYGFAVSSANPQDQTTTYKRDVLGRAFETTAANGRIEYRSYDASGQIREVWREIVDGTDAAPRWKAVFYSYDRNGRQTLTSEIVRSPLDSLYPTIGSVASFNAFGEQTSLRRTNTLNANRTTTAVDPGQKDEWAEYDDAGRVWKTNAGGVIKAYEYDLQGNVTAEVVLPSDNAVTNTDLVPTAQNAIRTEFVRDKMGRIVEKRDPAFLAATSTASALGSASVFSPAISWSALASATPPRLPYGNYPAKRSVLQWSSIDGFGLQKVRMALTVTSLHFPQGLVHNIEVEPGRADAGYLEGGWAENVNESGAVVYFAEHETAYYAITNARIEVWNGSSWVVVRDSAATQPGIELLTPRGIGAGLLNQKFKYKRTTDASFIEVTLASKGVNAYSLPSLSDGTYDYEFVIRDAQTEMASSTFTNQPFDVTYKGRFTVSNGRVTSAEAPASTELKPKITQTLDRWGNVTTLADPRNAAWITQYRYDHLNRLVYEKRPSVGVWNQNGVYGSGTPEDFYHYDSRGSLIAARDANGGWRRRFYDAGGQLIEELDATQYVTRHSYDALGRETRVLKAGGQVLDKGYDKLNRIVWQQWVGFLTPRYDFYKYDENGNRISQAIGISGDGSNTPGTDGEVTRYQYDTAGRLVRTLLPSANTSGDAAFKTVLSYDERGRKIKEVNGLGESQEWTYDYVGRTKTYKDLAGITTTFVYDGYGRLSTVGSAATTQTTLGGSFTRATHGQSLRYTYLANGWVDKVEDLARRVTIIYEYDLSGRRVVDREIDPLTKATLRDTRLMYDALGRTIRISDERSRIDYAYDTAGNRRSTISNYYEGFTNTVKSVENWYQYDAAGRITLSQGKREGGTIKIATTQGIKLSYDGAGNRVKTIQWEQNGTKLAERTHSFDPANLIIASWYQELNGTTEAPLGQKAMTTDRTYSRQGRISDYKDFGSVGGALQSRRVVSYDPNGWITLQEYFNGSNANTVDVLYTGAGNGYDTAGNLLGYQVNGVSPAYTQTYDYAYVRIGGGYREARVTGEGTADVGGFKPGFTETEYDSNGFQTVVASYTGVSQTNGAPKSFRRFTNSVDGRTLRESKWGYTGWAMQGGAFTFYSYDNGKPVGNFGTDPAAKVDFDYNYAPVSDAYPPSQPGQYVVQDGDSLQSIAYAVFGDADLWYLIADANGLPANPTLAVGQTLVIPNKITNLRNAADTFKPYNARDVIGDTTPELEYVPPPPPIAKCSVGMVVMVIVAVVVTWLTTGYAAPYFQGLFATWAGGAATGGVAAAVASGAGVAVGSAVGAAAGSVASQLVGNAFGVVDHFSWSAVGVSALAAGLTANLPVGTGPLATIGRSIAANAIAQGANMLLGQQERFSWGGVAAAAVGGLLDFALGSQNPDLVKLESARAGNFDPSFDLTTIDPGQVVLGTIKQFVRGVVTQRVNIAIEHEGTMDYAAIASDSFGNAIGNSIVGRLKYGALPEEVKQAALTDPDAINDYSVLRANGVSEADATAAVQPDEPPSVSPSDAVPNLDSGVESGSFGLQLRVDLLDETYNERLARVAAAGNQVAYAFNDVKEALKVIPDELASSQQNALAAFENGDYSALLAMIDDPVGKLLASGGLSFTADANPFRTTFGGELFASALGDPIAFLDSRFSDDGFGFNPISQTYLTPGQAQEAGMLSLMSAGMGPMMSAAQKGLTTLKVIGRLRDITDDAVSYIDSSLDNLLGELSPKRIAQYLRGSMQDAIRGKAVESRARTLVAQDDFVSNYVELGSLNRGADLRFVDRPIWLDWTTQKAWQSHLDRPYSGYGVLLDTTKVPQ